MLASPVLDQHIHNVLALQDHRGQFGKTAVQQFQFLRDDHGARLRLGHLTTDLGLDPGPVDVHNAVMVLAKTDVVALM